MYYFPKNLVTGEARAGGGIHFFFFFFSFCTERYLANQSTTQCYENEIDNTKYTMKIIEEACDLLTA